MGWGHFEGSLEQLAATEPGGAVVDEPRRPDGGDGSWKLFWHVSRTRCGVACHLVGDEPESEGGGLLYREIDPELFAATCPIATMRACYAKGLPDPPDEDASYGNDEECRFLRAWIAAHPNATAPSPDGRWRPWVVSERAH